MLPQDSIIPPIYNDVFKVHWTRHHPSTEECGVNKRAEVHVVPKVHLILDSIGLGGRKRYDELTRVVF